MIMVIHVGAGNDQPPSKRHRPVVESTEAKWLYGYHWARKVGSNAKGHAIMACQLCGKHQPNSQWATKGVVVQDESSLKRHESSVGHAVSVQMDAGATGLQKGLKNISQVLFWMHAALDN